MKLRILFFLLLAVLSFLNAQVANAATFLVTNTGDSLAGSLRQAIIDANNSPGADTISFLIPGNGVQTITPLTALPAITGPVTIDGYTQPGASANTLAVGDDAVLLIELNGNGAAFAGLTINGGNSTIRGLVINSFNGNGPANGISINTAGGNTIQGCFIGVDPTGLIDKSNSRLGINLASAGNTIGGTSPAARNVIVSSGFALEVPPDNAGGNIIQGNYFGTDKTGLVGLGTTSAVEIKTPANLFGGTAAGAGNVVSSNSGLNLSGANSLNANNNTVQGNYIGMKADGSGALANPSANLSPSGITMIYSNNNLIGGTAAGARNFISTSNSAISMSGVGGGNNTVQGNYIGLNPAGTTALGPQSAGDGIYVASDFNQIGGTAPGAGNIVTNSSRGLTIFNGNNNMVQGNYIGTDAAGMTSIPNNNSGMAVVSAYGVAVFGNVIGGTTASARNVISGNHGPGIYISGGDTTTIQGNYIGVAADGTTALPNSDDGIQIGTGNNVLIGGTVAGAGNLISNNGGATGNNVGVRVYGGTGNSILGNSIFAHHRLGIDLSGGTQDSFNVTANDVGDADTGPNNLQNYPVLTSVDTSTAGTAVIAGTLNSIASTTYRLEFFENDQADESGYGEGQNYLGFSNVTTDSSGNGSFSVSLPIGASRIVTATATDPMGNTSEFSAAIGQALNISTRLQVLTGEKVLIGGFIVTGTADKKVIIRGLGPSLSSSVSGAMADPVLELHDGSGALLQMNDDWKDTQQAEIEATGIPPTNDKESAIVRTLPANNASYTAILSGKNNTTGIGLVEAYDLDANANSKLANISTRGLVQTGNNVLIGGFIAGNGVTKVIVRGIGPSLPVSDALADPMLSLVDGNGSVLAQNDNWKDTQQAEIEATTIPPTNDAESAIVARLQPGRYTAIVSGKNGTSGVGLVEIYNIP